jgi:transposase
MQAVLFHHGAPHTRGLLKLENRERVAALKLPAAAREQLTIALHMIDAIDVQLSPFDLSLREYARQQPGCRTLTDEIYGIGELTSVTILAELGDCERFSSSRQAVRYGGLEYQPQRWVEKVSRSITNSDTPQSWRGTISGPRLPCAERAVGLGLARRAAGASGASALFVSETDDKPPGNLIARRLERVDREASVRVGLPTGGAVHGLVRLRDRWRRLGGLCARQPAE